MHRVRGWIGPSDIEGLTVVMKTFDGEFSHNVYVFHLLFVLCGQVRKLNPHPSRLHHGIYPMPAR